MQDCGSPHTNLSELWIGNFNVVNPHSTFTDRPFKIWASHLNFIDRPTMSTLNRFVFNHCRIILEQFQNVGSDTLQVWLNHHRSFDYPNKDSDVG